MTAYIPNYQKKIRIFEKRETELKHAIKNSYSEEKVAKAAGKLREAKLQIFKAKFSQHTVLPASKWEPTGEALIWKEMTIQEITLKYSANPP